MSTLQGKVALVTGASRGIGAAIAKRLAADGADVAITYASSPDKAREVAQAIEKMGRHALAIQADSANMDAVKSAVEKTASHFGRLDILVNNAGIFIASKFEDTSPQDMERLWNINVQAPIVAIQAALKHMPNGGRIIIIGSCVAERIPMPGITLYSMTKAAVNGLARGLARDLGQRAITVNVVEPGPIDTDMNPATGDYSDEQRALTALGRYGTSEEVADTVTYLAGKGAGYVTGAAFLVDGGYSA
jgi:NAD(P)-dependent dehydrogenase (short-subunit alcohol dehydrogenase family)